MSKIISFPNAATPAEHEADKLFRHLVEFMKINSDAFACFGALCSLELAAGGAMTNVQKILLNELAS